MIRCMQELFIHETWANLCEVSDAMVAVGTRRNLGAFNSDLGNVDLVEYTDLHSTCRP